MNNIRDSIQYDGHKSIRTAVWNSIWYWAIDLKGISFKIFFHDVNGYSWCSSKNNKNTLRDICRREGHKTTKTASHSHVPPNIRNERRFNKKLSHFKDGRIYES